MPRLQSFQTPLVAAALLLLLSACKNNDNTHNTDVTDNTGTVACTMNYVYGLGIQVLDATTGEGITHIATARLRDGDYTDSLSSGQDDPNGRLMGAGERPGTYTVTVEAPGYQPWTQDNVQVTQTPDKCHVKPVTLTAKLQKTAR